MSITRGNAAAYKTDAQTVSGREISIKLTDEGMYWIDVEGVGDKPELCTHRFTSLSEARKAVNGYVFANQTELAKKEMLAEIAARDYSPKGKRAKTDTE